MNHNGYCPEALKSNIFAFYEKNLFITKARNLDGSKFNLSFFVFSPAPLNLIS